MKVLSRHAAQWIRPVPGTTPESLDAVDVPAPLGAAALVLANSDVLAERPQPDIGTAFIGVVQTSRGGTFADESDDALAGSAVKGKARTWALRFTSPNTTILFSPLQPGSPPRR
jgi:hypothetical protein